MLAVFSRHSQCGTAMAYSVDFKKSARRHLMAAQVLYSQDRPGDRPGCKAVAGYLFGIAGELAIKQIMRRSGIPPLPETQRRDDPFFAHFPTLKTRLATLTGRRAGELQRFSNDSKLFQNWDTKMRYAPTADICEDWVDSWKVSAEELVNGMDTI
jgi:hypothetical protein